MPMGKTTPKAPRQFRSDLLLLLFLVALSALYFVFVRGQNLSYEKGKAEQSAPAEQAAAVPEPVLPPLDTADYDRRMKILANIKTPPPPAATAATSTAPGTAAPAPKPALWPAKAVYPEAGALLPFYRIVAYYGNLYSKQMGVLGQYPEDEMLARLEDEVKKWQAADPDTPVMPALHYIAVTAQGYAGADGKYRLRMPDSEIDKVLAMADKIHGIVFLDVQVGKSTLEEELPRLEKYLAMPNVHLGIDPEFSIKTDSRPGKIIGTFDASDINYAAGYLAGLVKKNHLTPKVLVVHRFTENMVTNYKAIKPLPEVQIVMNMDGWGGQAKKKNTYQQFIYKEPVQFTGFKLFYKNDVLDPGTTLMTPEQVLSLSPKPIYIQYQ